jgi:hypothetical protein
MTCDFYGSSVKRNGMMERWAVGVLFSQPITPISQHSSTPIL